MLRGKKRKENSPGCERRLWLCCMEYFGDPPPEICLHPCLHLLRLSLISRRLHRPPTLIRRLLCLYFHVPAPACSPCCCLRRAIAGVGSETLFRLEFRGVEMVLQIYLGKYCYRGRCRHDRIWGVPDCGCSDFKARWARQKARGYAFEVVDQMIVGLVN
jgi:hypothetical protein